MAHQIPLSPDTIAAVPHPEDGVVEIAPDLAIRRLAVANVAFCGSLLAGDRHWVLIDTGVSGFGTRIKEIAEERFGKAARPAAIVLTHAHFDHVGDLQKLAESWDVPIYAHPLEFPYLNGSASYPHAAPEGSGGLFGHLSSFFPRSPVNVRKWLQPLPEDGTVPEMPGWRWIHTPGHSVGHVSLWRAADKVLLAGDAVITTDQSSAYSILTQKPEMHGPPEYFTADWTSAKASVQKLADLEPELLATGHGQAMRGGEMRKALRRLADEFDDFAIPKKSRYIDAPVKAEDGSAYEGAVVLPAAPVPLLERSPKQENL